MNGPRSERIWTPALLVIVAWGALSFGAVYPWAYWPLLVGSVTVGVLGWRLTRSFQTRGLGRGLGLTLATVVVAIGVQLLPLSRSTVMKLSPSSDAFFATPGQRDASEGQTIADFEDAAVDAGAWGSSRTLSVDPRATGVALIWLVSSFVLFIGCTRAFDSIGASSLARGTIALGVLLAFVGIIQRVTFSGQIYGVWLTQYGTNPFGPFVNKNHFAGWMIMCLPLALGYFCAGVEDGMRGVRRDWRNRVLWFSSSAANELLLVALAVIMMGLSLVLTLSRSGITCFALALLVLGSFVIRRQGGGLRRSVSLGYLLFVGLVALGWVGVEAVVQRFAAASWSDIGGRVNAWQDGLSIVGDFPLAGTGLDTYGIATVLYAADPTTRFVHAHNDYVQLAAEGGVLVGLPLLIASGFFIGTVRQRFRESKDDVTTHWLRAGAVTGLTAIALQEVVDFSLQIPGNAVLFVVLCAIAIHPACRTMTHRAHTTSRARLSELPTRPDSKRRPTW